MSARSWLRSLATRPTRTAPRPVCRPRVESLDDRTVPATLGYATTLPQQAFSLAVDAAGDSYVSAAGSSGTGSGTVYKFDRAGHLLATNSAVPGAGAGIALDPAGDVYVTSHGIVTELDPTLQQVLFTETLPGATVGWYGSNWGTTKNGAIAVAGGKVYVAGCAGTGLPTTANAFQTADPGAASNRKAAYLAVIDPTSPAPYHLTYCTYLGGAAGNTKGDAATGLAVDAAGDAYLTGLTDSTAFPTTAGAFQTTLKAKTVGGFYGTGWNTFVAKIDPVQSGAASLVYSTYLGGSGLDGYVTWMANSVNMSESSPSVAVDAAGNAYVAGSTTSADFPTTVGAFQRTFTPPPSNYLAGACGHGYVTKLNPTGTGLVYSTFLGGKDDDGVGAICVDSAGDAWLTGWTHSTNFPTVNPLQATKGTGTNSTYSQPRSNAFVTELDPTGGHLLFSTFWGGSGNNYNDAGMGIGLDASGDVFVAGVAGAGFPTSPGAYQTGGPGFLIKITP